MGQERHRKQVQLTLGSEGVERFDKAVEAYSRFMQCVGIDLNDHHSKDTPSRVAKMFLLERCLAIQPGINPPDMTTFRNEGYNEIVVVRDIPYASICAHHHVNFFGVVHIAYLPGEKVTGLSKLARVVGHFAAQPHIQEELTMDIASYLTEELEPLGLAVRVIGEHLCMTLRGVKSIGSKTVTNYLSNLDKDEVEGLFNGRGA